jgi:hypothetical protein
LGLHLPLGIQEPETASRGDHGGRHGQCGYDRDQHAYRQGDTQGLEVGQSGEAEAVGRTGNGQTRAQDDVGGAAIHGVEGGFAILAGVTCLLVAADEKYRVIRSGGDGQGREEIDRKRRESD